MIHVVTVRNRCVSVDQPLIVAGGRGSDLVVLDLDDEWQGFSVSVVLGSGESAQVAEWDGDPMSLPEELVSEAGWLPISIVGELDGALIVTRRADRVLRVVEGGEVPGD